MIELQEDKLAQILKENPKVMVQYGASWCGNCRITKPKFKRMSGDYDNIEFVYVDAEKLPESRKLAKVNNLPTFAAFNGGEFMDQFEGNKIDNVKALADALANN
jgi:thiol-disulfide isomerase/thioredoxin